ncbi:MAG: SoxR reducing system RseC family protein, partial [Candidatus Cloacimonetes bacterium]|nr:SoxR reducing system RseC family protein [Candidatus Cloacimonadota bacterium]
VIEDLAIVKSVAGKSVTVQIERGGGCKSCSMQGLCLSKSTPAEFVVVSDLELAPGDQVQLEIGPGSRVLISLLVFLLPVLALFAGYLITAAFLSELYAALSGFALMALSFLLIRYIDKKCGNKLSIRIGRKM